MIFVRGITTRSGTNYLGDLLALHPQVGRARHPVWEDFSLDQAAHLDEYFARSLERWPRAWDIPLPAIRAELLREFGDGLVRVLIANPDRPSALTVAKSPSVRGLRYFFDLFPDDYLIVLVRDGRSVVESKRRSFGQSFDSAAREWATSADTILQFSREHARTRGSRWILLRYEDVLTDVIATLQSIGAVTGLDPAGIDLTAAEALPVRGSSSFGRVEGRVDWRCAEKNEAFKPLERAAAWDGEQHKRFNWLAGDQMLELGYGLTGSTDATFKDRLMYQSHDLIHILRTSAGRARRSLVRPPANA